MGVTVRGSAVAAINIARRRVTPTQADALFVGEGQRARILRRTERGVDLNGRPFTPYSTKKIYVSPEGRLGARSRARVSAKQRKAAVKRLFRTLSRGENTRATGAPYVSRTGLSICFPGGYRQYKRWAGRSKVDLRGLRAPNMLQAIQIRATEKEVRVGIYGPKAKLAQGHNEGGRVPRRRFFGVSKQDRADAVKDLRAVISRRLNARV